MSDIPDAAPKRHAALYPFSTGKPFGRGDHRRTKPAPSFFGRLVSGRPQSMGTNYLEKSFVHGLPTSQHNLKLYPSAFFCLHFIFSLYPYHTLHSYYCVHFSSPFAPLSFVSCVQLDPNLPRQPYLHTLPHSHIHSPLLPWNPAKTALPLKRSHSNQKMKLP